MATAPPRPAAPAVPAREEPLPEEQPTAAPDTSKGDALFADAEALAQRNEWDLCVHTVLRAMAVGCTDMAQAHFLHGIALGETGLPAEAAAALRKCIELNPAHEHVPTPEQPQHLHLMIMSAFHACIFAAFLQFMCVVW